jgi:hypothetical protein
LLTYFFLMLNDNKFLAKKDIEYEKSK